MLILRATLLMLCLAAPLFAQSSSVTIGGRVADAQGAVMPGATITLRNLATNAEWVTVSAMDGRFLLPLLPPGVYQADASLDGFAPWRADALTLLVGQSRELDIQLAISGVRENVLVSEPGRVVTSVVDGVIPSARIQSLPLNGRNFLELSLLIPGNQPTPTFDPTKTNSVLIGSSGQMGRGGNITIDGQNNNDDVVGGPLTNLPIDAVQEFQIATSGFGADLGRSAGSVINVITQSGSNVVRGSAALFARSGAWQASSPLIDDSLPEPPFDRQQVAGSIGGPLTRGLLWFGAVEHRNQDGAVLIGARDPATRSIRRSLVDAPLDDTLWFARVDSTTTANRFMVRYAGEQNAATGASLIERAIGSASQRQRATNRYHDVLGSWMATGTRVANSFQVSVSTFFNETVPVTTAPQLTFPSLQDGASFRMPQLTQQTRLRIAETLSVVRGAHALRLGGEMQRIDALFDLGVFQQGRIELVEDFPAFDRNSDGVTDDNDLLFAVTLRSGKPTQALVIPDADNTHFSGFLQDDWTVSSRLRLNLGLRYEIDTDVNNQSRVADLNPIVQAFVRGPRKRDINNLAPRLGFAWSSPGERLLVRGGYGTYFDRIVLQIVSLERGLDGRALPIEVRAGNLLFVDPDTGRFPPVAPTLERPFGGFILPGAGASGINIIDSRLQNPTVHEFHLGVDTSIAGTKVRIDGIHSRGRNFLIGRTVGEVFNPVVGGPDRVVNIESSAKTAYNALLVSVDRDATRGNLHMAYTLAKASNYANDDQVPFLNGPIDPNDLARERGPAANDRRHRFVASGLARLPGGVNVSALWTLSSGVPMDIMMPDGSTRIPVIQRNAGGRQFKTAADLNTFIRGVNASGGLNGVPLPLVSDSARFSDAFSSLDLRLSRTINLGERVRLEPMLEVFNLFNVTNVLGSTNVNYSGFTNVLVRDSDDPSQPGYHRSSRFGQPASTAGGIFGSGGARALQLAARLTF